MYYLWVEICTTPYFLVKQNFNHFGLLYLNAKEGLGSCTSSDFWSVWLYRNNVIFTNFRL